MQTGYQLRKRRKPPDLTRIPAQRKRPAIRNRLKLDRAGQTRRVNYVDRAVRRKAWGVAASFDIYDCDPATIRDADKIRKFVVDLCQLIDMKRFGETTVVHFGENDRVAGFSMMQLIETSLISAHFANQSNTTYLDVFSCKPYDPSVVEEFALKFFGGTRCITHVNLRL